MKFRLAPFRSVGSAIASVATYLLTGYIALAAVLLIASYVAPRYISVIGANFVPQFVLVACLQLALLHWYYWRNIAVTSQLIAQLQTRALGSGEVRTFTGPSEFHQYLGLRFPLATIVQVTHFSSGTRELASAEYGDILKVFVERGGIFRRVIVDTLSRDVWEKQREFLATHVGKSVFLHYLAEVHVEKIKLLDIMLIDNVEVCLGGGYSMGYQYPTISIRHPEIVAFFAGYYRYLREKSTNVKIDPFPQIEIVEDLVVRSTKTWKRSDTE
jgi:hypothetical protein